MQVVCGFVCFLIFTCVILLVLFGIDAYSTLCPRSRLFNFFKKKLKCFEIFVHLAFTQHINVILIANR